MPCSLVCQDLLDGLNSGCKPIQTAVLVIFPHAEVSRALGVRYVAQSATQADKTDIKGYSRGQMRLASATLLNTVSFSLKKVYTGRSRKRTQGIKRFDKNISKYTTGILNIYVVFL
jgi:hypothetical protein